LTLRAERPRPFVSIHHVSLLFPLAVALAFLRVTVGVGYRGDVLSGAAIGAAVPPLGIKIVSRTRFRAKVIPAASSSGGG
jgi:membrane-associated phospholipid phosphatase